MAYRYEQTPTGTDLIIDGWEKGLGDSPYLGLSEVDYGSISNIPGEITVNYPLTTTTVSGGTMDKPQYKAVEIDDGNGGTVTYYYILDAKCNVFYSQDGLTWTFGSNPPASALYVTDAGGIVWWKGYLFVFWLTKVWYSSDHGVTFTDWTTAKSLPAIAGTRHMAIAAQDDAIYFCAGSYVGSILQNAGSTFDPTNTATYTFNAQALAIPTYDDTICLAELNNLLLVGGALNKIYPWDRISPTFGQPLFTAEGWVQRMVTMNTNTFIFCGAPTSPQGRGNIYITNGSQIDLFKKIPDSTVTVGGSSKSQIQEPYWRFGDAMFHRGKLWFGAVAVQNNTSTTYITDTGGVWSIDVQTKALSRANLLSGGNTVCPTVLLPRGIQSTVAALGYMAGGSADNAVAGGGFMNTSTTTMSTAAKVITDKIPVATKYVPKTFEQFELKLYSPLASGETIQLDSIDESGTTTTIGTMTSTDGFSLILPGKVQAQQWLLLRVTMTPTSTTPTYIRLKEIRARTTSKS